MTGNIQLVCGRATTFVAWGMLGCTFLSGCGGSPNSSSEAKSVAASAQSVPEVSTEFNGPTLPVAAISTTAEQDEGEFPLAAPEKGTPEWLLREIATIRTSISAKADGSPLDEKMRERHEQIIQLARQAIAATHKLPEREQLFNNAVHYLSDARLALAMGGDTEQSQLLVADADSLYRRDPKSFAAIESAQKVVQLAQQKAEQLGHENSEWLTEFANQSRLFADKFPHEPNRSALALLTAGQLCDRHGMTEAARNCFALVRQQFPDTIFAEQVNGFLRRLSLVGQPLELAGPTIDGGYVSIDDHAGHDVVVVFWAATSPQFQQDCDRLKELHDQYASQGLWMIGVNLDLDEGQIDQFLAGQPLPWPHIFHSEPDQRGSRHPLARYYGVQQVPTYWLIDATGTVAATPANLDVLSKELAKRLGTP